MENTLQLYNPDKLECIFDLKGSTFDRAVKGELKKSTIRKDNDYKVIKRRRPNLFKMQKINKDLIKNLRRDVYFFKLRGLLDYSLLFAVEETDN